MARFTYYAFDVSGTTIKGVLTAASEADALSQLGRKGLTPVSLTEGGSLEPWWNRDISVSGAAPKLKLSVQAQVFASIATMLSASFPLPRALDFAHARSKDPKAKRCLAESKARVDAGGTFSEAIRDSRIFDDRVPSMLNVGEASNRLSEVTKQIANMLEAEVATRSQLRQALIYPMILLAMSVLVLLMLVFFLAPTLVPVFASSGVEPPALLMALDSFRNLLLEDWIFVLTAVLTLTAVIIAAKDRITRAIRLITVRLPLIKGYHRAKISLRFVQTLRLMLGSGARLPAALSETIGAADGTWKRALESARIRVEGGETLTAALSGVELLDPTARSFIEAGEDSDRLVEMLQQAEALLLSETSAALSNALRVLTPVLTLIIGGAVATLIFSTIGAILDLNDLAQ